MSLRVMKVKHNARVKFNKTNKTKLFSLSVTDNQGSKSNPFKLGGCCSTPSTGPYNTCQDKALVPIAPSKQQSYHSYLRRATTGLSSGVRGVGNKTSGGLSARVVSKHSSGEGKYVTYKKPQAGSSSSMSFSTSDYISDKKNKTIACIIDDDKLNNDCYNLGSCNTLGGTKQNTKDLMFLTQEQQLARIKSHRTTCSKGVKVTEKPMMKNGSCA